MAITHKLLLPNGLDIVILAANYNPTIVSKDWLSQKGILTSAIRNFTYTPVFSLTETDLFTLIVDERRLQLIVLKVILDNINTAVNMLKKFVTLLPETPYRGIGFNYHYFVDKSTFNVERLYKPNKERIELIASKTYELGVNLVFEYEDFIAGLYITPSLKDDDKRIRLDFNFHSDVENATRIMEKLVAQDILLKKAAMIVSEVSKK